jgi:hypothetical protein
MALMMMSSGVSLLAEINDGCSLLCWWQLQAVGAVMHPGISVTYNK